MIVRDTRSMADSESEVENLPSGNFVRVCALDEIPLGLGRAFIIEGRTMALFRTRKGRVFAVDNRCPHKGGPLADGMLAGDAVVCPLHAFAFDMATGQCDQPHLCSITTHPVLLKDDGVFITPPSLVGRDARPS